MNRPVPALRPATSSRSARATRPSARKQAAEFGATEAPSPPDLPATITPPATFTVDAEDGEGRYRVHAEEMFAGATIVVATPLDDVDATLQRLS